MIRRAPFRVFDAIEPLPDLTRSSKELRVAAIAQRGGVAFRFQLTPEKPGETTLTFDVKVGDKTQSLDWDIQTHNVELIPRSDYGFNYTNWFSLHEIKTRHNLELWSDDFWTMLGKYADLMAYGGQDTFWLRWTDFFMISESGDWVLLTERLARYVELFLDAGFDWIEGAPIASRPNGDWSLPWLKLNIGGVPASGEECEAIIKQFATNINSKFKDNDCDLQCI